MPHMPFKNNYFSSSVSWLSILLVVTAFVYSNTLIIPFYLDDIGSIVENTVLHGGSLADLYWHYGLRTGGYLTFFVNYLFDGVNPYWYHVFNVCLHLINGVVIYLFSTALIKHMSVKLDAKVPDSKLASLFITAIWLLHPLNSQPVIYIVQRLAELAALGFFITGFAYFQGKKAVGWRKLNWMFLFLIGLAIGVSSKQNYFTIFVFIIAFECFFSTAIVQRRLLVVSGVSLIVFSALIPFITDFLHQLDLMTRENHAIARSDYFLSQLIILATYIRKFVFPYDMQLFMHTEIFSEVASTVVLAFLFHSALFAGSIAYRKKYPLIFVGLLLFYCAHLVESSIIPITDFAFEHRTYIPNVGLCFVLYSLGSLLVQRFRISQRTASVGGAALLMGLVAITFVRIEQWKEPLSFFEREVTLSPLSAAANQNYGYELIKAKKYQEAETYLANAYHYKLKRNQISVSSLNLYMTVLFHLEKYSQANKVARNAMKHIQRDVYRSQILGNMSYGYIKMGMCDFAIGIAKRAIQLNPSNQAAKNNYEYCMQILRAERQTKQLGANR